MELSFSHDRPFVPRTQVNRTAEICQGIAPASALFMRPSSLCECLGRVKDNLDHNDGDNLSQNFEKRDRKIHIHSAIDGYLSHLSLPRLTLTIAVT